MNKVLIELTIPTVEENYNIFIPINKKVGTVKKHILQALNEITDEEIYANINYNFYDSETGIKYPNDVYVKDSGIKNGTKLILL